MDQEAGALPIVETWAGKVRGSDADGIFAFKGIPYAAPTGGADRFMPPRPAESSGVCDALDYRGHAPPLPGRPERRPELKTVLGPADTTPESVLDSNCRLVNDPDRDARLFWERIAMHH